MTTWFPEEGEMDAIKQADAQLLTPLPFKTSSPSHGNILKYIVITITNQSLFAPVARLTFAANRPALIFILLQRWFADLRLLPYTCRLNFGSVCPATWVCAYKCVPCAHELLTSRSTCFSLHCVQPKATLWPDCEEANEKSPQRMMSPLCVSLCLVHLLSCCTAISLCSDHSFQAALPLLTAAL